MSVLLYLKPVAINVYDRAYGTIRDEDNFVPQIERPMIQDVKLRPRNLKIPYARPIRCGT